MHMYYVDDVLVVENFVCLDDWLKANGYKDRDTFVNDASVEGMTEEEREKEWDEIVEKFYAWCDKYGLEGEV